MHEGGKIEVLPLAPVRDVDDLSMAYTPGVARVCMEIAKNPAAAHQYTIKQQHRRHRVRRHRGARPGRHRPEAAMPVMEGKALLFKHFAGVDAFPICLNTKDPDEIVETVLRLAPTFGGINLEDIAAPGRVRHRGASGRPPRHPGVPRRPARHRHRHARRARERAEDRRQEDGRPQGRRRRRRRGGCRGVEDPDERRRAQRRRLRPPGCGLHRPRRPEHVEAVVRREHQPRRRVGIAGRGHARRRRLHRPVGTEPDQP